MFSGQDKSPEQSIPHQPANNGPSRAPPGKVQALRLTPSLTISSTYSHAGIAVKHSAPKAIWLPSTSFVIECLGLTKSNRRQLDTLEVTGSSPVSPILTGKRLTA